MILQIADILSAPEIKAISAVLADEDIWADGAATAGGQARAVKSNEQAAPDHPSVKGVMEKVRRALLAHPTVAAAAQPAALSRLMINRYRAGMGYGAHVDAAYIDGARTDISFTLFLSEPGDYDGGALVIDSAGAEDAIKLSAGAIVLYPATSVHRVEPVTRGTRLAAVGWITSRVREAERRALLFDLELSLVDLAAAKAPIAARDRLVNLRNNLLRMFGD